MGILAEICSRQWIISRAHEGCRRCWAGAMSPRRSGFRADVDRVSGVLGPGRMRPYQVVFEGIDHHVADKMNFLAGDAFEFEVGDAVLFCDEEQVAQSIC